MRQLKKTGKKPEIVINGNQLKGKKLGRPSSFNQKIADDICALLNQGLSLRAISKIPGFPSTFCISYWLTLNESFYIQYMRAKRSQALIMAEDIIESTKDRSRDVSGELEIPNNVAVNRDRLIYDAQKWYLSKLLPAVFGDKLVVEGEINHTFADRLASARLRLRSNNEETIKEDEESA